MSVREQLKNPMTMMPIGMLCLVIALVGPKIFHPTGQVATDWVDGVQGLLFGLSIGINLCAVRLASRQRRCSEN
jgi:hypothetical protein